MTEVQERLDFSQFYEGLFIRGLAGRMTERCKERLRADGLDLDRPLEVAYPAAKFGGRVRIVVEELYPGVPREEALRDLGASFLRGYFHTTLGKAMAVMMRVIGPMKTLGRMQRNFRTGTNYMESSLKELGPRDAELWLSECHGIPDFFAGISLEGARTVGTKGTTIDIVRTEGSGATFRVRWD